MRVEEKRLIEALLNIPKVRIEEIELDSKGDVIISVESALDTGKCRKCGREIKEFHGHDDPIQLRHLPMLGHKVYIRLRPKRYICRYCSDNPTSTLQLEWYDSRSPHTKTYEKYILLQLVNSTIEDISIKEDVGYKAIEAILDRHISHEVNWDEYDKLKELGIDEISLKKGHKDFVTIVIARPTETEIEILAVLPDKRKETVKKFLESIPARLKRTIKKVCTDLYDGFINAVKEALPRAKVVGDRFHVAKLYRDCADALRKKELKRLKKKLSKEKLAEIKGAMWAFRKNKADLEPEEQELLNRFFEHSPKAQLAYKFRERLTSIFEQDLSKEEAARKIKIWRKQVKASGLTCFDSFFTTLDNWLDEITNYFVGRDNSGYVEGFNNKLKVLKRRCYGIFNIIHLFQRIFLDLKGYERFAEAIP